MVGFFSANCFEIFNESEKFTELDELKNRKKFTDDNYFKIQHLLDLTKYMNLM